MSQQKSVFGDATCQEDLQHINEIQNTNIEATSASQLAEILYKSVTRPVQGKVDGQLSIPLSQVQFNYKIITTKLWINMCFDYAG